MSPLSDPFMDDPVEPLTPPVPSKEVRRHPVWNSPTAARQATKQPVARRPATQEPAPIRVASRAIRPIRSSANQEVASATPTPAVRESSVLKRTSLEVEVESDEAPTPPAAAVRYSAPKLLNFDVPVNPLRQ